MGASDRAEGSSGREGMRAKRWTAPGVVVCGAGAALGQPFVTTDSSISVTWSFSDNGAGNGNNNGIMDQGETALFTLSASFTNQFGVAHFSPAVGGVSSGTILGLGSLFMDVRGDYG